MGTVRPRWNNNLRNLLISFPRSGSTWVRLFFEWHTGFSTRSVYEHNSWDRPIISETDPPIFYRAHRLYDARSGPEDRVLFLYRNPFDAIVSNLKYHDKMVDNKLQDPDVTRQMEIFTSFISEVESCRNDKAVIEYENLVTDFVGEIKKAAEFLGFPASDDKIREFMGLDESNFLKYIEYFTKEGKQRNITYNKNFFTRREFLSEKQVEIIQQKINTLGEKYIEKSWWKT